MKKNNTSFSKPIRTGLRPMAIALFVAFMAQASFLGAQDITFNLGGLGNIYVSGIGPTICQSSSASIAGIYGGGALSSQILIAQGHQLSNDKGSYHVANAGVNKQIVVDLPGISNNGLNAIMYYNFGPYDGSFTSAYQSTGAYNPNNDTYRHVINIKFPVGTGKGYLACTVSYGIGGGSNVVIPFVVEGATIAEVPILGTTVQPQMPYMVLHVPPGDGSSSKFVSGKTTCREIIDTYAEDNSNSANVAVKLGVAGEVGFIVTTKFEFSVTFSGGVTAGDMFIKTEGNQTCVTTNNTFETTGLGDLDGGGDVFIGYGTDLAYGVYPYIKIEGCDVKMDNGLIYLPVGVPREFALTKTEISALITTLEATVADSLNVGAKTANDAQNQIDVWKQVLAMNDANVNNPNNAPLGNITYGAGSAKTVSNAITVTQTNSIQYEQYLEGTAGVEAVIEVAGSGVTGGYEYKAGKRYGATQNQTNETTKMVEYFLNDNDDGDNFNVDIVSDPMFGTPVFRIKSGTKSSCPYQGGFQRDQPQIKHVGTANDHITILGAPVSLDSSAIFQIQVCNNNPNESRTYLLSLDDNSNPGGARVLASGFELNVPRTYSIAANSCTNITIEVKRVSNNSTLAYPNLELVLYPECEPEISSSIFASVYFGNATSTGEALSNIAQLEVFPNPAAQTATLAFDLLESAPIRVELYDMLGRLCPAGLNEQLPVGTQQRTVDVSQLPNGVYWLRVQSGTSDFLTRKLVVSH